jgi:Lon protease-like protein
MLKLALQSLWARRLTAGLTLLAVAISVTLLLGVERVRITDLWQEEDGLRVGEVEPLPPWQSGRLQADQHSLAKALQDVFNDYPEYAALYPEPDWEDASWVAQRWLEVLPLSGEQKLPLLESDDCSDALRFLMDVVHEPLRPH